jgi:hypothetical protein
MSSQQNSSSYRPGLHLYPDAVTSELKPLPVEYMPEHRLHGCTKHCIPAEPKPDHEYQRCWVCQRLLWPEPFDPDVEIEPPPPQRFCSDTCSLAYAEWYRKKWERERRGDGTSSISFGFEQIVLDGERDAFNED